jgi:hypothetical protein
MGELQPSPHALSSDESTVWALLVSEFALASMAQEKMAVAQT